MARPSTSEVLARVSSAPVTEDEAAEIAWLPRTDPRGKGAAFRPHKDSMVISVIAGPKPHEHQRRGNISAAACRWFDRMGVERILFRMSQNGEYCLLEGDLRGNLLRKTPRGGYSCSVTIPPDIPVGTVIEMTDFKTHLIGRMPKKEDDNGIGDI